jgi:hypothetical protein
MFATWNGFEGVIMELAVESTKGGTKKIGLDQTYGNFQTIKLDFAQEHS